MPSIQLRQSTMPSSGRNAAGFKHQASQSPSRSAVKARCQPQVADGKAFRFGEIGQQSLDGDGIGRIFTLLGGAHARRVEDQPPEHHPDAKHVAVEQHRGERGIDESVQPFVGRGRGGIDGSRDRLQQALRHDVESIGDQFVDLAEMMGNESLGNAGLGGDLAHGDTGVAVLNDAAQSRFAQLAAAVFRRFAPKARGWFLGGLGLDQAERSRSQQS
jgi:hypothetical protein